MSVQPSRLTFAALVVLSASIALARPAETPPATPPPAKPAAPAAQPEAETPPARRPSARQRAKDIKEIKGIIECENGTIGFRLEPNKAPLLCANFCNLVRRGFFEGRPFRDFSRVVRQCGTDSVWYTLPREFDSSLFFDKPGRLAMSRDNDEAENAKSHGTRFFITIRVQDRWNLVYPVFGNVTSGLEFLFDMEAGETIRRITVDGDVDRLLEVFAPEVAVWNAAIDEGLAKGRP